MRRGEIYLASFPFGDTDENKLRPVLLLTGRIGTGTEVLCAYISSVIPVTLLDTDVELDPATPRFASTKLRVRSVLRLHKLATIHVTSLKRLIGIVDSDPLYDIRDRL